MLTEHLKRCNRFISLDPCERSVFISHYNRIRDRVINLMKKEDDLFNKIFHETQLSGSYADQLKISEPNEYDVLMILKLPNSIVKNMRGRPGYVEINVMNWGWHGIERILDRDGYLMQNKVFEWLRTIMKRIFPSRNVLRIENHEYVITHSVHGPANTLDIQCGGYPNEENNKFSIDFVGALRFSVKDKWMADSGTPKKWYLDSYWNAIPKPRKSTRKPSYSQEQRQRYPIGANVDANTLRKRQHRNLNRNRAWICSYAEIERDLIHRLQSIKPLIRIFKKIRDTHKMTNLKSFYIKQIFIHERMLKDSNYWQQSLGKLFLAMLDVIINRLENRNLPFFWHQKFNLFNHYNFKQMDDLEHKFKRIRHDIEMNEPDYIYQVILTDSEQQQIIDFN